MLSNIRGIQSCPVVQNLSRWPTAQPRPCRYLGESFHNEVLVDMAIISFAWLGRKGFPSKHRELKAHFCFGSQTFAPFPWERAHFRFCSNLTCSSEG